MALMVTLLIAPAALAGQKEAKPEADAFYVVKAGDILGTIAPRVGCTVDGLMQANGLKDDRIRLGQTLNVTDCSGAERAVEGQAEVTTHLVTPGENLSKVAKRYGTTVGAIKQRNPKIKGDIIKACQRLKVLPRVPTKTRNVVKYKLASDDTLDGIARLFGTNIEEIQCLNPKKAKDPRKLRIGDVLEIMRYGPASRSKTVGRPQAGSLVNGEQMPPGPGYFRRRPRNSWGTNETITGLLQVIGAVRGKHSKVHDVAVGDISARKGGKLAGHKSHQSGRDVDLGLYFSNQPKKGPKAFISARHHPLDIDANWTLLEALVGASASKSQVEYIFLGYAVQEKLYKWALKKGKSKALLERMFQYPRGKRAMRGVVRHEPGHHDHYHIRFKCPRRDDNCV